MVEIQFACEHCGEVLATDVESSGLVESDDFHDCFGERAGYLGRIARDRVFTRASVKIVVAE